MTNIKQKVQTILTMKRYCAEQLAHEAYSLAATSPLFREVESEYAEAKKNALLFGDEKELVIVSGKRTGILSALGLAPESLEGFYCAKCRDTGKVDGAQCECVTAEYSRLLSVNGIDPRLCFDNSVHSKQNSPIFEYCRSYAGGTEDKPDILLVGKSGTGKTYLASAIGNALAGRGGEVVFYTAFDLNLLFLKIHLSDLSERFWLLNGIIHPEYLIVDDLGTEEQHKVTLSYLYNLINQRIVRGNKTIVTSNLHPEAILSTYGERIMSRLTDKSITYIAALSGGNLRHRA